MKVSGFLAVVIVIAAAPALAQTLEGVSPGAVDRIDEVEGRCPTFIWGGVSGALAYELVVYRLPDEPQASGTAGIDLTASDEVLYSRVPGGATAWQPRLADGLDPGESFVWFVRAVLREEAGEVIEAGDWSIGRFFSIPAMPSAMEVDAALEVLQRYTDLGNSGVGASPQPSSVDQSRGSARSDPRQRPAPPVEGLKSVPTATAAIKGTIPDATGETYGVVGISSSPDGAGVAAANTAGGPDLVLDGTEDGESDLAVYQWGIDRASAGIETFELINSIGGTFDLFVQGNVNATSFIGDGAGLTGVDADTLDGIDGAAFATEAEAAALVSVHAASADHDGRYYTETELATVGGGGAVNWDNLTAVPAGFADGVDDDTQYNPGTGLIFDSGQIRIDPGAFLTQLSVLDSSDFVGPFTSIAIGADGLGLIAYQKDSALNLAHCDDAVCSSATTATLDPSVGVGEYPSIAIGADGLGLISYYDNPNSRLKVAHCDDITCSSVTIAVLDSIGLVGKWTSIAIGIDGLGLISYFDDSNDDALKVAHCNDVTCSSARIVTLDSPGVGTYTSIAIGADGRGIVSYHDRSGGNLKIAHCDDIPCNSAYITTLDSVDDVGEYTSIAIGADGFPLISYYDVTNDDLKVTHCSHIACFDSFYATLDSGGDVGRYTSIAIGADGSGIISYQDSTNTALKVAHCAGATCSAASTATIDNDGDVGRWTSMATGADGLGLISYYDVTNEVLKAAHLGIGVP